MTLVLHTKFSDYRIAYFSWTTDDSAEESQSVCTKCLRDIEKSHEVHCPHCHTWLHKKCVACLACTQGGEL